MANVFTDQIGTVVSGVQPGSPMLYGNANYVWNTGTLAWVVETQPSGGGGSGSNAAAGLTSSAVPASADYQGWNSGGNLVGTSLTNPLPIQPGTGVTFPVSGTVSVGNFPATQTVAGTVTVGNASIPVTQSGTWTVQQGTPPWSVSQSGVWSTGRTWTLASGTDSVTVSGTVAISGTVPVTGSLTTTPSNVPSPVYLADTEHQYDDNGYLIVSINTEAADVATNSNQLQEIALLKANAANTNVTVLNPTSSVSVSNFPATQNVAVQGTVPVTGSLITTPSTIPSPTYLADTETQYNDSGYTIVSVDTDSSDIATLSQQLVISQLLAAGNNNTGVTVLNPTSTVTVANQPQGFAVETAGNLQKISDTLEAILLQLRVNAVLLSQLSQPNTDSYEQIATDITLTLQ
jgi:hypothetical protein